MFGGYTDVAGYYLETEGATIGPEDDAGNPGPIPPEYLPAFQQSNPWQHSGPLAQQDFVLIAEFSEQEGPKPLITIPKGADAGFDLNEFSVRIMSVDFQTMSSETFAMTEDTQLIISESRDDIYAYVHHFTLFDSQARGFVRPFCMSYVTTDHRKLISFYDEMSQEFSKVSRYLKYGNLMLFVKDMTHYLTDLQFTRERYMERQVEVKQEEKVNKIGKRNDNDQCGEEVIFRSMSVAAVENCIKEVKDVLETASGHLNDQQLEKRFRHLEDKSREQRLVPPEHLQYSSSLTNGSPRRSLSWLNLRRAKSGSFSEAEGSNFNISTDTDIYHPKLVRTINRRRFDKALRTVHELCQWGAKDGLNRLRSIHKYFSRALATLEIERKESRLIDPPATLLTIGRNVTVNFLSNIDMENSSNHWPLAQSNMNTGYSSNNLMRRWLSDETLASFHSVDSFLSTQEDQTAFNSTQSSFEPAYVLGSTYVEERDSLGGLDVISLTSREEDNDMETHHRHSITLPVDENSIGHTDLSPSVLTTQSLEDTCDDRDPNDKPQRVSVISAADHITNFTSASPGFGVLHFVCQHPYSAHLIYSLLCGRPVVIIATWKSERDVRAAVNALWMFVPGHSSRNHMVIPWQTKPLRITDLSKIKLIGLCRPERRPTEYMVPLSIKRYVSILDLEKKTLCAPSYESGVVTGIFNKRRLIRDEKAYIAYIHSVLLDIASKAHIYYHAFCINAPNNKLGDIQWQNPHEREAASDAEQEFLAKLKMSPQDTLIIKHFVEVVKQQQVEEIYSHNTSDKDSPVPLVKLDFSPCAMFKTAK